MNKQIIIIVIIIITSAACSLVLSEGIPPFSPLSPLKRSQMKSQLPTSIVKKYILDIYFHYMVPKTNYLCEEKGNTYINFTHYKIFSYKPSSNSLRSKVSILQATRDIS